MDESRALDGLSALGQESRLRIFRLLVKAGREGVAAGSIAASLGIVPNTLSTHLDLLVRAGLVIRRRDGRAILYAAHYPGISGLLSFLMEDCCGGRPELCAPALKTLACAC
ncbi:MAG: ArsR/SmtB family transcription factor [Bauldia sp.]